ncbi:MAG: ankyrin repeat domain-containing protein [bacterium]
MKKSLLFLFFVSNLYLQAGFGNFKNQYPYIYDYDPKEYPIHNKISTLCTHHNEFGEVNTIKNVLKKYKETINKQDLAGYTPLHLAAYLKNIEMCTELIKYGADTSLLNEKGRTAYDEVIEADYASYGLYFQETTKEGRKIADITGFASRIKRRPFNNYCCKECSGYLISIGTLLHWGVIFGETERVEWLLEQTDDLNYVNLLNKYNKTPLDYALELQTAGIDKTEIIEILRKNDAKTSYELGGKTPYAKKHLRPR